MQKQIRIQYFINSVKNLKDQFAMAFKIFLLRQLPFVFDLF